MCKETPPPAVWVGEHRSTSRHMLTRTSEGAVAERLLRYYQYVGRLAGPQGRMRLAIETKMPSTKAAMERDTAQNVDVFKIAVEKITGKPAPDF